MKELERIIIMTMFMSILIKKCSIANCYRKIWILINRIEKLFKKKITKETLLIFDEIQKVLRALSSLKYFNEDALFYNVIFVGSL